MKRLLILSSLTIGLFGCANNVWVKPGASVNDFNVDRAQCNAQSYSIPFASIYQQTAVQNECMQGKGWSLRDKVSHEASTASTQSSWQSVLAKFNEDWQARCNDPAYKMYFSKTACLASNISFDQMTDSSKITPQQKTVFLEFKKSADAQFSQYINSIKNIPNAPGEKSASLYQTTLLPETDKNSIDLYSGKITWGEYNQKRKEINAKFLEASKNLR